MKRLLKRVLSSTAVFYLLLVVFVVTVVALLNHLCAQDCEEPENYKSSFGHRFAYNKKDSIDLYPIIKTLDINTYNFIKCRIQQNYATFTINHDSFKINQTSEHLFLSWRQIPHTLNPHSLTLSLNNSSIFSIYYETYYQAPSTLHNDNVVQIVHKGEKDPRYLTHEHISELQTSLNSFAPFIDRILDTTPPGSFSYVYFASNQSLVINYRHPFEYYVFHENYNPVQIIKQGSSRGGVNQIINLSTLASGTYWVVIRTTLHSFRISVKK